jgi:hypothetical protein
MRFKGKSDSVWVAILRTMVTWVFGYPKIMPTFIAFYVINAVIFILKNTAIGNSDQIFFLVVWVLSPI